MCQYSFNMLQSVKSLARQKGSMQLLRIREP